MAGPVERAVRASIEPGKTLYTVPKRAPFVIQVIDERGVVLLLGRKRAWTRLSWDCLESIPPFLRERGCVRVASVFSVDSDPDSLDGYLKRCIKRATAGWVASLLVEAGVVAVDAGPPATVRLRVGEPPGR
jgi:hypothetical protein